MIEKGLLGSFGLLFCDGLPVSVRGRHGSDDSDASKPACFQEPSAFLGSNRHRRGIGLMQCQLSTAGKHREAKALWGREGPAFALEISAAVGPERRGCIGLLAK